METTKMVWSFFQNEVVGMGKVLKATDIETADDTSIIDFMKESCIRRVWKE